MEPTRLSLWAADYCAPGSGSIQNVRLCRSKQVELLSRGDRSTQSGLYDHDLEPPALCQGPFLQAVEGTQVANLERSPSCRYRSA